MRDEVDDGGRREDTNDWDVVRLAWRESVEGRGRNERIDCGGCAEEMKLVEGVESEGGERKRV